MFGLCMPTGETYLVMKDGKMESIMMSDEGNPKKHIMNDKHILETIKHKGYQNIDAIVYTTNYKGGKETKVSMADYYAEHGQELEG